MLTKPAPKMVTIIGSTTVSANMVAIAASTALPPLTSISVPAREASGGFEVTMPLEATAGCLMVMGGLYADGGWGRKGWGRPAVSGFAAEADHGPVANGDFIDLLWIPVGAGTRFQ